MMWKKGKAQVHFIFLCLGALACSSTTFPNSGQLSLEALGSHRHQVPSCWQSLPKNSCEIDLIYATLAFFNLLWASFLFPSKIEEKREKWRNRNLKWSNHENEVWKMTKYWWCRVRTRATSLKDNWEKYVRT